ncbi:MAG: hypothetical protein AAFR38_11555 [Planctomycetota bacterium]
MQQLCSLFAEVRFARAIVLAERSRPGALVRAHSASDSSRDPDSGHGLRTVADDGQAGFYLASMTRTAPGHSAASAAGGMAGSREHGGNGDELLDTADFEIEITGFEFDEAANPRAAEPH